MTARRKWAAGSFTPCSPKHKSCSPAHAAMVWSYREERRRQEIQYELPYSYDGDRKLMRENGISLVTFKDWLIANKRSEQDKEDEKLFKQQKRQQQPSEF